MKRPDQERASGCGELLLSHSHDRETEAAGANPVQARGPTPARGASSPRSQQSRLSRARSLHTATSLKRSDVPDDELTEIARRTTCTSSDRPPSGTSSAWRGTERPPPSSRMTPDGCAIGGSKPALRASPAARTSIPISSHDRPRRSFSRERFRRWPWRMQCTRAKRSL